MEGKNLEREIKTIQNMLARLIGQDTRNYMVPLEKEHSDSIIAQFRPPPEEPKQIDTATDLMDDPQARELRSKYLCGEMTKEQYTEEMNKLGWGEKRVK